MTNTDTNIAKYENWTVEQVAADLGMTQSELDALRNFIDLKVLQFHVENKTELGTAVADRIFAKTYAGSSD